MKRHRALFQAAEIIGRCTSLQTAAVSLDPGDLRSTAAQSNHRLGLPLRARGNGASVTRWSGLTGKLPVHHQITRANLAPESPVEQAYITPHRQHGRAPFVQPCRRRVLTGRHDSISQRCFLSQSWRLGAVWLSIPYWSARLLWPSRDQISYESTSSTRYDQLPRQSGSAVLLVVCPGQDLTNTVAGFAIDLSRSEHDDGLEVQ